MVRWYKIVWTITKTMFKVWIRYPENTIGFIIYLGVVGLFAYALFLSGFLGLNDVPYYIVGLTIYSFIGAANSAYADFYLWREDILAKPINVDLFLLGNYFGGLSTNVLPTLLLFFAGLIFYWKIIHINILMLIFSLLFGILSSIGVSYIFASMGLRFRPEGYLFTSLTFIFSILCGILIPLYLLPKQILWLSYLIPYTWAIDLFRYSILSTSPILTPSMEIIALIISTVLYLFIGRFLLNYTLKAIRSKKVIIR